MNKIQTIYDPFSSCRTTVAVKILWKTVLSPVQIYRMDVILNLDCLYRYCWGVLTICFLFPPHFNIWNLTFSRIYCSGICDSETKKLITRDYYKAVLKCFSSTVYTVHRDDWRHANEKNFLEVVRCKCQSLETDDCLSPRPSEARWVGGRRFLCLYSTTCGQKRVC